MARELQAKGIRELVGTSPVILEIGCNDGTDTQKFLDEMPEAIIHCFEPDPRPIARFKSSPLASDKQVTLHEVAVCDKNGQAVFYGSSGQHPNPTPNMQHYWHLPECDLSGSLYKPTGHIEKCRWMSWPEERRITVQTIRLDSWFDFYRPTVIDFIWADVQGAEHSVIRGGRRALSVTKYFYTEFYDEPMYEGQVPLDKLQEMLPTFDLIGKYGGNALFRNKRW